MWGVILPVDPFTGPVSLKEPLKDPCKKSQLKDSVKGALQ